MTSKAELKEERVHFVFSTNGPVDKGTSGGAVRELQLMKRIGANPHFVVSAIASKVICKRFRDNNIRANYVIIPSFIDPCNGIANLLDSFLRSIYSLIKPLPIYSRKTVLHSPSDFLWDTIPSAFKRLKNRDIVWFATVYHIIPSPSHRSGGLTLSNLIAFFAQRFSLLLIGRWADIIQTETSYVKEELIHRFGVQAGKIVVCESGINPVDIDLESRKKLYDACFLARLHQSKGIFDAISAWALVVKVKKDAQMAIAGGGSVEVVKEIKRLIAKLGLEKNISFLGYLSEQEKYDLFLSSKLYLLPSYEEGIPITFYEAMYCGLPVITYYLQPYSDIKDNIISVSVGDVNKLSETILMVLSNADLSAEFIRKGLIFSKEHTWNGVAEYIVKEIFKTYQKELSFG
jgi:glycosyltransferase involved in cell wall biosynthesis